MKSKVFRPRPIIRIEGSIYVAVGVGLPVLLAFGSGFEELSDVVAMVCLCGGLSIAHAILIHKFLWEKFFATLTISEQYVCWKCLFRRSISMSIEECGYIGVQEEESANGLPYPFVYFSSKPYPLKYSGKINKLPCTQGFIKFWYSEDLCQYLVDHFQGNQTGALLSYRIRSRRKKTG